MQLSTKVNYRHKFLSAVMLASLALVFLMGLFDEAQAQGAGSSIPSGSSASKPEDANQVAAWDIRKKYFKRFPYAKYAGPTGKKIPDNPDGHDLVVEIGGGGGGAAEGSGGPKKRESAGPGKRLVLAYDICHVHADGIGHWLPGAEWYHQPQPPCPIPGCYTQPKLWTLPFDEVATKRDEELFDTALGTYKMPQHSLGVNIAPVNGLPLTDTQFQIIDREDNQRFLELLFDPEHMIWLATNTGQIQGASAANSSAGAAESSFNNALHRIRDDVLINVANENSGQPTTPDNPNKTNAQAVWMVMKMYKEVFLPMAILFLLPGAILTQVQSFVYKGFFESNVSMPFEGILRATIAIFLIPATQLIVSYSIDIGNSLADSVKPWANTQTIFSWSKEQSFNPPIDNHVNVIEPGGGGSSSSSSSGGGGGGGGSAAGVYEAAIDSAVEQSSGGEGQGKANDDLEKKTKQEKQKWLSQMMQLWFNSVEYGMAYALIALTAYQMVFVCYLFLLGPLSACFFAWPSMQGASQLFRQVFSSWTNAVINVSLWRFYWMVIMAVMTQRLLWLQDTGGINFADQWEMMVLTCFLGLMLVVPFNPFQFDPGSVAAATISKGAQMGSQVNQQFQQQASAAGVPQAQIQALSQPMQQATSQMGKVGESMGSGVNIPNQALGLQQGGGVGGGLGNQGAGMSGAGATQPPAFAGQPTPATVGGAGAASVGQPPLASGAAAGGQSASTQPPSAQAANSFAGAVGQQSGFSAQNGAQGGPPVSGMPPSAAGGAPAGQQASPTANVHPGLPPSVANNVAGSTAAGLHGAANSIASAPGVLPGAATAMPAAGPSVASAGAPPSSAAGGAPSASPSADASAPSPPTPPSSPPPGNSPPPSPPAAPPPSAPPPPSDNG